MKQIFIAVVALVFLSPKNILAQTAAVELVNGMKINSSTTILRADYNLDAASNLDSAIVIIEGKNIVVDFSNALIHSKVNVATPDQFRGVVVLVRLCAIARM